MTQLKTIYVGFMGEVGIQTGVERLKEMKERKKRSPWRAIKWRGKLVKRKPNFNKINKRVIFTIL